MVEKLYTLKEFADAVNITPELVLEWEEQGLIRPSKRDMNGVSYFSASQVALYAKYEGNPNIVKNIRANHLGIKGNKDIGYL